MLVVFNAMARGLASASAVAAALLLTLVGGSAQAARVDTQGMFGSAYTPSAAPNTLWWPWAQSYAAAVDRELGLLRRRLGFSVLRVFLHTLDYEYDAAQLLSAVDALLAAGARHEMRMGLVLFDSCWNTDGANASVECVPVKGRHNGCWYESPLVSGQTSLERYRPYVEDVVRTFGSDPRVAFIEIYNEPRGPGEDFVFALRDAGFRWATALSPAAPVISCWDDSNNTEVVDHHEYDTDFKSGFFPAVFSNPAKGAIVTEGGSRWFQPPFGGDFGSPLTVMNFLEALKLEKQSGAVAFVPGMMSNWISFVGNDNTRWHWGSPDGAKEPAIPWDGWLFPDGTPVSHTEAGASRRYVTGVDEFLSFSKFLTVPPVVEDGDAFLTVAAGSAWAAPLKPGLASVGDGLFEASVWVDAGGAVSLVVRAGALPAAAEGGTHIERARGAPARGNKRRAAAAPLPQPQPEHPPSPLGLSADDGNCTFGARLNGTDICPGGSDLYRDFSVQDEADPLAACAAACCAWSDCTAWIVRPFSGTDRNCTNTLCCWMKPLCYPGDTTPNAAATSAFKAQPPGPPLPSGVRGYNVTLDSATQRMTVLRDDGSGAPARLLGSFDLTSLENGLVLGAWNIVRVLLETSAVDNSLSIRIWFNPMFPETGEAEPSRTRTETRPDRPSPRAPTQALSETRATPLACRYHYLLVSPSWIRPLCRRAAW